VGEVNQQSGHLSDAQVEQYGNTVTTAEPEADDRDHDIETHLADCGVCRERVLAAQRTRFALLAVPEMSSGPNARRPGSANPGGIGPGPNCPDEDDLRKLAAGLCPPDQASKLTQHVAQCDHCGPILRGYIADFSDEVSAEDEAVLGKLKSSSADWQKKLVEELQVASGRSSRSSDSKFFPWRWVMAPVALAACAAIGFAIWYQQRETPEKVEKLLATAYTEQRTIEMRFSGAEWGEMRVRRGLESGRSEALLEAQLMIRRSQPRDPNNVGWLRAKAEAELLDTQPDQAMATLSRALEIEPESIPLLLDLSIAYVQLAQTSQVASSHAKAIDLLTQITRREPGNKEALFDLALACTSGERWDQAIASWEAYLKLDPSGPWANEARHRLNEIKQQHSLLLFPGLSSRRFHASIQFQEH
jgi:tetratricopeptide (TPR) repeat protein